MVEIKFANSEQFYLFFLMDKHCLLDRYIR